MTDLREHEAAARNALGLPEIGPELSGLYDQLFEERHIPRNERIKRDQERHRTHEGNPLDIEGDLLGQIATLNAGVRTEAGFANPGDPIDPEAASHFEDTKKSNRLRTEVAFGLGDPRTSRRPNLNAFGEEQSLVPNQNFNSGTRAKQFTSDFDQPAGLPTALATLYRDYTASLDNTPIIQQPVRANVLGEEQPPFEFRSGTGAANVNLQSSFDLVKKLSGLTPREGMIGAEPGVSGTVPKALKRTQEMVNQNITDQVIRDTLVTSANQAQRAVQQINALVQTGRRKRRGSNVSLPKVALAGLQNK